jgi:hypothetical protein
MAALMEELSAASVLVEGLRQPSSMPRRVSAFRPQKNNFGWWRELELQEILQSQE